MPHWETRQTTERVVAVSEALSYFSHSHNQGKDGPPPLVSGNVSEPLIAYHVATVMALLKPFIKAYNEVRKPLAEKCKVPPNEGETIPAGREKIDMGKLTDLMKDVLAKEIEVPNLEPLNWTEIERAKIQLDPVVIELLGDFLQGQPKGLEEGAKAPAT